MASQNAERREPITRGTGNVFADLGFPDAAKRQAKLRLAYALNRVLDGRKLSQGSTVRCWGGRSRRSSPSDSRLSRCPDGRLQRSHATHSLQPHEPQTPSWNP